ncbi:MAG: SDR family NAD(P)-dependent oxidoreductase, partial [Nocardioides sp.]
MVTGAGAPDGVGFATAALLGRLGAAVVLGATSGRVHERVEELAAAGVDASAVVGDLTGPSAAHAVVDHAVARHGRLDIVVNNAGMVST